jgi:hypothetical protein
MKKENPMRNLSLVSLLALTIAFTSSVALAQDGNSGGEVLNNDKVITMVKAGLPNSIIVNKIHASKCSFDTSTGELIRLKNEKVPDDIINAMVEAAGGTSTMKLATGAGDTSKTDPNDPLATHEAGIYLYEERDGTKKMTQLEPSVSKQQKTGGVFTSAMTAGLTKVKFKAALSGRSASLQLASRRPVFYFYFEVKNAGLSSNSYYATSPSEFALVNLDVKENTREVTVSQANAFGAQSGTMDKASRSFKIEKIGAGVYRVIPDQDLADGEYGFYNGGGMGGGATVAKIFDFGIKLPR